MTALITDTELEERLKLQRRASGSDRYDEVWDGVYARYPWSLELYRHNGSELVLAAQSSLTKNEVISKVISSAVVPLDFQLLAAKPRPQIRIAEIDGRREWEV